MGVSFELLNMVQMQSLLALAICVLFFTHAVALEIGPLSSIRDVGVNKSVIIQPLSLEGFVEESPGMKPGDLVVATRLRVPGISRLQHVDKFYHTYRIKVETPSRGGGFFTGTPKIDVCVHQNEIMGLAQCGKESWRALDKAGSWSGGFSPFETKFIDIRIAEPLSDLPIVVSVLDESSEYRLVFLGLGTILLILAPIVSGWVPFYYTTAMTLGIIMIVLVIVYQTMKLLPTGRKSSIYILLYGSLVGLGTVVVSYFGSLVSSVLLELGFSEDMYNPMAVFLGVGIALLGAWLGYWGVRKLVIAEDGSIDDGTSKFVKWAIRVFGSVSLLQSSKDPVFMLLAFVGGAAVAYVVLNAKICVSEFFDYVQDNWYSEPLIGKGVSFQSPRKERKHYMTQAQMDALRRLPGTDSLVAGAQLVSNNAQLSEGSTPGRRRKQLTKPTADEEAFVSTFHKSPGHKPMSKQEYEEISKEYTLKAVKDLENSREFRDWKNSNTHRFFVAPHEHREERHEAEIALTANLAEAKPEGGFFGHRRR
ncbi:hypothetical protein MPTK2_3g12120 [Marchantia polymorpha subsp. ruderalis]